MKNINTIIPGRRAGGTMEPSGSVWPNGEFTIGYAPCGGMEREFTASEYAEKWDTPIGSSNAANSHSPIDYGKPKRGTKGLTSHGKRMVRNAVARIQRLYGKKSLSFVTLTLPSVSFEESWYVSSNWSEIVRVFYQKLGRALERKGLPGVYCGCTELQPKRASREEHPALHLHFVIVGRRRERGSWALSPGDFREMWRETVSPYLQGSRGWSAVENVQMVKKDVASYMAKYLSKGISLQVPPRSDGTGWSLPTSWYNISLALRQWVNRETRRHPNLLDSLERAASEGWLQEMCHYLHAGVVEEMPGPGPHYWVGKLKGEAYRAFVDVWGAATLL